MTMRSMIQLIALCLAFLSVASSGEAKKSKAPAESFVAPSDKALLVFVRSSKMGKAVKFSVVDDKLRGLARLKGNQHAVATVDPGKHKIYVSAENTDPIQVEVGAGRTYIILTRVRMGFGKARVTATPIQRNHPDFADSVKWVRDTSPSTMMEGLQEWVEANKPSLQGRIGKADSAWAEQSDEWRAQHSMGVEDGRTAEEAGKI